MIDMQNTSESTMIQQIHPTFLNDDDFFKFLVLFFSFDQRENNMRKKSATFNIMAIKSAITKGLAPRIKI